MLQFIDTIYKGTNGPGLVELTDAIKIWVKKNKFKNGILNLFILHTSASLLIQENADPDVLDDLITFYSKVAPYYNNYKHSTEGPDDMPAHIKSSLTNTSLSISIQDRKLMLGTWQGIFLFEHRNAAITRKINLHFLGD